MVNDNMSDIILYKGDCLQEMNNIADGSIDFILTDLPYNTTALDWDKLIPFDKLWEQYNRIIKPNGAIALFGQEPFSSYLRLSNIKDYKFDWYWEKERLTNIAQVKKRAGKTVETISMFYKKQPTYNPQFIKYDGKPRTNKIKDGKLGVLTDSSCKTPYEYHDNGLRYPTQVLRYQRDILTSNLHPTQKPVALLEFLINTYTNEGETVLDSCMGSGSTGVACKNLNRNFIGIEIDDDYFNIANERLK